MRNFIQKTMLRLRKDERGVTLVEYGVAITLAVSLGVGALLTLSGDIGDTMTAAGACMPDATGAFPAGC